MHSARSMTLSLSHSLSLSLSQAAQAAHAHRFKPLPTLRRDSTGAPSPTKALGKQPALSASKPETGKQRAGDTFVIDLASGVITTTTTTVRRNKRHHNGQAEQAVRSEPNFSAKRAKRPSFGPRPAGNQACHEPELIATVFGTSRRQGLAAYFRNKVTG